MDANLTEVGKHVRIDVVLWAQSNTFPDGKAKGSDSFKPLRSNKLLRKGLTQYTLQLEFRYYALQSRVVVQY